MNVDSLPPRPLSESEVAALNRADALGLAVAVGTDGPTDGLVLATDAWVKGLVFDGNGWVAVETVDLDDAERYEGLRACEAAVRGSHPSGTDH